MTNAVVIVAGLMLLAVPAAVHAEGGKRPMKIDDLFRFKRVSDPQISPDGKTVVYVVGEVDLAATKLRRRSGWPRPTEERAAP